jgi:hypothetical protein
VALCVPVAILPVAVAILPVAILPVAIAILPVAILPAHGNAHRAGEKRRRHSQWHIRKHAAEQRHRNEPRSRCPLPTGLYLDGVTHYINFSFLPAARDS